jgi:hypothetical protein
MPSFIGIFHSIVSFHSDSPHLPREWRTPCCVEWNPNSVLVDRKGDREMERETGVEPSTSRLAKLQPAFGLPSGTYLDTLAARTGGIKFDLADECDGEVTTVRHGRSVPYAADHAEFGTGAA